MNKDPFIVYRDGEVDPNLSVLPPSGVEAVISGLREKIGQVTGAVALQARMATFDVVHGTHYRRIRNELVEQKKRKDFERSIGLVAVNQ